MTRNHTHDPRLIEQIDRLIDEGQPTGHPVLDDLAATVPHSRSSFERELEARLVAQLQAEQSQERTNRMQQVLHFPMTITLPNVRTIRPAYTLIAAVLGVVLFAAGLFMVSHLPPSEPTSGAVPPGGNPDQPAAQVSPTPTISPTLILTATPLSGAPGGSPTLLPATVVPGGATDVFLLYYPVQPGDDCASIAQRFNIADPDEFQQFVALNDLGAPCTLPDPGTVIMIPQRQMSVVATASPTFTATPVPFDLTGLPPTVLPPTLVPGALVTATPFLDIIVTATPIPSSVPSMQVVQPTESTEGVLPEGVEVSPWNDPRRVTVLLLGIDQREGEAGPFATDTIILLSVDPVDNTAAILSIPRDLWVTYPGVEASGKIDAANIVGDTINYPGGGGPALAMKTVTALTGVTVDYYVLINFEVFTTLIDAIGPIEVCPAAPIDDDQYPDGSYGVIAIRFDAGCQDLDGERLLQYVRTRHGDSDFHRASRQQEVIMAVRDKVLTLGGILDLLPVATDLWDAMQTNVRTNMPFADMLSLGLTAESIPQENIRQGQISFEDVQTGVSPEGEAILLPVATDIDTLVQDLFRPAGAPSTRGQ